MDIGPLTIVAAVFILLTLGLAVQIFFASGPAHGRASHPLLTAICLVIAIAASIVEQGHQDRQRWATEALLALGTTPDAQVDCQRLSQTFTDTQPAYDGWVGYDTSTRAELKWHICQSIDAYASGTQSNPTLEEVAAVHLIAHEGMHVLGYWDEAEAECRAVQLSHIVAEALGASPEEARELQARYFVEVYPRIRSNYISGECREGGALDIHPDRVEFP